MLPVRSETFSTLSGQQSLFGRKRSAAAQGDQHWYHHRRVRLQGWRRARRRHPCNHGRDHRRQELRKGASPRTAEAHMFVTPLKIHYISESIRCCGAGTAADTEFVTASISSNIELHALSTGRKPRVVTAMTMLKQHLFRCVPFLSFRSDVLNLCHRQISRACRRCARPRGRRRHRSTAVYHPSARVYRQAAVCDDGIG